MPKLICVKCKIIMKVEKVGVTSQENTEKDEPYKIWSSDKFKCPNCNIEVLSGFGFNPLAHSHDEDFEHRQKRCELTFK